MNTSIKVTDWILERRQRVMYLIINWAVKELADQIQIKPHTNFNQEIALHVRAYIEEGKVPPADIAPAILNIADDYIAGRDVQIRAGDYIMIQNHLRHAK